MSDRTGQGDRRVLSVGSQGLTSDPRPSSFLGSWTKPGTQRPASVGTAGTVLPRSHYPGQPPRYASPCRHPAAGPQEMRVSPPEACLGQARLGGGGGVLAVATGVSSKDLGGGSQAPAS